MLEYNTSCLKSQSCFLNIWGQDSWLVCFLLLYQAYCEEVGMKTLDFILLFLYYLFYSVCFLMVECVLVSPT